MGQIQSQEWNVAKETHMIENGKKKHHQGSKEIRTSSLSIGSNFSSRRFNGNEQHLRKLSNVSNRNIQLLSMKPRSERDTLADDLKQRRRSSLINLILGAPSSGPRFSDDLCSLNSRLSNFGIEFFGPVEACLGAQPSGSSLKSSINSLAGFEQRCFEASRISKITVTDRKGNSNNNNNNNNNSNITTNPKNNEKRRRSSLGSFQQSNNRLGGSGDPVSSSRACEERPSLVSNALTSVDLNGSFELTYENNKQAPKRVETILETTGQGSDWFHATNTNGASRRRLNTSSRVLRRSGSELSLYSCATSSSLGSNGSTARSNRGLNDSSSNGSIIKSSSLGASSARETKLIIVLQVCLPFILAGFGNVSAGLVLSRVAHWEAFRKIPTLIVLLPPLVGLKGNIEMTLASRLSTLSNLNLLDTKYRRRRAYASNLILTLSQAIGMSLFASFIAILCELMIGIGSSHQSGLVGSSQIDDAKLSIATNESALSKSSVLGQHLIEHEGDISIVSHSLVVLTCAITTSITLVLLSSIVMTAAIALARFIQVNPDNLSTLVAAMYGDVSCVFVYGMVANWIYQAVKHEDLLWPILIITTTSAIWPLLVYCAYKLKETHGIALPSLPPMVTSILISMGSGTVLSLVVEKFKLLALYQPVVNGFSANLIAVQASRVSTWLWCNALQEIAGPTNGDTVNDNENHDSKQVKSDCQIGILASFESSEVHSSLASDHESSFGQSIVRMTKELPTIVACSVKKLLWSFLNNSPNSIAARLLLVMIIPAHSIYFIIIWLLSTNLAITITWQFYLIYISLCLVQVLLLLTICEPFMTLLMNKNLDPDIFGISILMALADLTGTLCLTGAFHMLASIGDVNAT